MSFVGVDSGERSASDPDSILPDFPPIADLTCQNDESLSKIKPLGPSVIKNMDDTAIDVEVKEEIGDLFMGRSIDDEIETVFPNGLILIHDQPAQMTSASDSRPERQVLTYTPVYMDEKGSPSYLQFSTPRSSIIRTKHSELQFVQHPIQRTKIENNTPKVEKKLNSHTEETNSGQSRTGYLQIPKLGLFNPGLLAVGTIDKTHVIKGRKRNVCYSASNSNPRMNSAEKINKTNVKGRKRNVCLSASNSKTTMNSGSKDPLAISPPTATYEIRKKQATNVIITKYFLCTLCGMKFCTFAQRNHHVLQVHEHNLCSHTSQEKCNVGSCHVNICIPTNQHLIEVHKKKALSFSSNDAKLGGIESESEPTDPLAISPTKPEGIIQGHFESNLSVIQVESILNIPPMEKRYKCTLCDLKFVDNKDRNDHIIAVHEEIQARSNNFSTRWRPAVCVVGPDQETREERKRRQKRESRRRARARERQRQSETPEQR